MSRLGSFPLESACEMLNKHAQNPRIVLDPFCGKGTTLLAARLRGSEAYGIDTGPEAIVCSQAKLAGTTLADAERYLQKTPITKTSTDEVPNEVKIFFHPATLPQILSINNSLQRSISVGKTKERETATTLQATLLGILHGHASYSLSISSAHAYAMSPAYVERYAAENGLERPLRDVKQCLLAKLRRCLSHPLPPRVKSRVVRGRAQDAAKLFPRLVNRVDCILTSPPYLASHTYAKDNWLRQWLLGFSYRDLAEDYLQTGSLIRYAEQMQLVLTSLVRLLRPGGRLICVIGHGRLAVTGRDAPVSLQQLFERLLGTTSPSLKLNRVNTEYVMNHRRYLHSLKNTNGHNEEVRKEYVMIATKPA